MFVCFFLSLYMRFYMEYIKVTGILDLIRKLLVESGIFSRGLVSSIFLELS